MRLLIIFISLLLTQVVTSHAQDNRVEYNDQQLFLNGSNIAWVTFAYDVGPNQTDFDQFEAIFQNVHESGGNSMRLWLHINGEHTPAFDEDGMVTGPGNQTIEDLEKILDLAWENEIGLMLTLWSFDMLRESFGDEVTNRAHQLLRDSATTASYINNSLIPMVDSLKGHPGIQSWEIFNEPEGMSEEHGWDGFKKVSMNTIQKFINRTAGAIHRTDSTAKVTNGAWSFIANTDINGNTNYYRDDRLIEAGGDTLGTLDFYTVHFYDWAGTELSPFHHPKSHWELDKPLVVAEFHPEETLGVPADQLYDTLYQQGYAGALSWSWASNSSSEWAIVEDNMKYMWDNYKNDINLNGTPGDPPNITLTSPADNTELPADTSVTLKADAEDPDGEIVKVEFMAGDTLLSEITESPYSYTWENIPEGNYHIKAVATDDSNLTSESETAFITVGSPSQTHYEAENASISGSDLLIEEDPNASGGSYVFMDSQNGSIEWTLTGIPRDENYNISFGYSINEGAGDKVQNLTVNDSDEQEVQFINTGGEWREKTLNVNLNEGLNTITIIASWGYTSFDYLSVDTNTVSTANPQQAKNTPAQFKLEGNHPNPFNPQTVIPYQLSESGHVTLQVYDVTGRMVKTLINKNQSAGSYQTTFEAGDLSSGIYLYRISVDDQFKATRRMLLIK